MTAAETNAAVRAAHHALFDVVESHFSETGPVCRCPACEAADILWWAEPERAENIARDWDALHLYAVVGVKKTDPSPSIAPPGDRLSGDLHADAAGGFRDASAARRDPLGGTSQQE